jgi:hypothetical protein
MARATEYAIELTMPRGPRTFRQQDVTRALRASVAAGVEVRRVEIDREGKIVLVFGSATGSQVTEPAAPLDSWRASRDTR